MTDVREMTVIEPILAMVVSRSSNLLIFDRVEHKLVESEVSQSQRQYNQDDPIQFPAGGLGYRLLGVNIRIFLQSFRSKFKYPRKNQARYETDR
jgi:hypothetical protein